MTSPLPTADPVPADLRERLEAAAQAPTVVFATDFDGVVAPLGDDPMAVRPTPGSMELLREASGLPGVTVALVSGRDLDTLALLTGVRAGESDEPIVLLGSHGAQASRPDLLAPPPLTPEQSATLAHLDAGLVAVCDAHPGARIERKPAAVVLHTRGMAAEAARAATQAAMALAETDGVHPVAGKDVVEFAVTDATKGSALRAVATRLGADVVCYFGDDVTDETAFTEFGAHQGHVTVKVGAGDTAAVGRVADEAAVVEAFHAFVDARRTAGPGA